MSSMTLCLADKALRRCGSSLFWIVGASLMLIAGCDGGSSYPVEGSVSYADGSPVTGGSVVFSSLDLTPAVSARGDIEPDGTFRLGTARPHDGAPAGRYRAVVVQPLPTDLDHPPPPSIHPRYADFASSGLEFEVAPEANQIRIVVERP